MIIQEPIKATIWFALENYAYNDAIFISERLYSEVNTEENLYLLATAYFRSGKQNVAYSILTQNKYDPLKSPKCHFLRAKCCLHLGKIEEATNLLLEPINDDVLSDKEFSKEDLTRVYGETSSFVAQILGHLFYKLEDFKLSAHYYSLSLKINPFLWSSYEKLLQIDPSKVDQEKLFNINSFDPKYSCGTNPLINLLNSNTNTLDTVPDDVIISNNIRNNNNSNNEDSSHYFITPELRKNHKKKIELSTPYVILKKSPGENKVNVITPETDGNWNMMTCLAPTKNINKNSRKFSNNNININNGKIISTNLDSTPSSHVLTETSNLGVNRNLLSHLESSSFHSFGVLSLDQDSVNVFINDRNVVQNQNQNDNIVANTNKNNNNKNNCSKIDDRQSAKVARFRNPFKESKDAQMSDDPMLGMAKTITRRSTRLNTDQRSIKENNNNGNSTSPTTKSINRRVGVTPMKRLKRTCNFNEKPEKMVKQNNENESSSSKIAFDLAKTGMIAQRTSANGLIELIRKFATAYKRLAEYRCKEAIELFKKLPTNHYSSGFVSSMIGRCYFEMGQYEESINFFKMCRVSEPYRLQGLEIYSTALWHLQRELELSCLSQELIQFDKLAPETWCVAGNCFALQKDHEISIKFLKRAIQVDPSFSYAYTLLGHELISADELDNAMSCFTNATRIDPRHYNAWCGIGLIYYKQEKYENAQHNYKRALEISKFNPILMCHLAIVKHHLKKSKEAIALLNEASKLDPDNVLIKYHRASIRFTLEEYNLALEELEELKTMVPKEYIVYFLIGKIHKARGDTHLAVMNFSWAVHIDPKGSANQHKEFTEPNQTPNDELIVHPSHADSSSELPSTPGGTTPFTLRSTYITGPISSANNYGNIALNEHVPADVSEIDSIGDAQIDDEEMPNETSSIEEEEEEEEPMISTDETFHFEAP